MPTPEEIQQRRLEREISARKQAEALLEQKSLELYIEAQERQDALVRLRESEERYRLIVEMSPDAILVEIDSKIVFANSAARLMFAERGSTRIVGQTLDRIGLGTTGGWSTLRLGDRIETVACRLDGTELDIVLRCMPLVYDGKPAMQVVVRDISDRKQLEKQLAYQATHDPLTGVSNRGALLDQLTEALAYARRHRLPVWVAFLDLDRFKQINDRFGHRAGDHILEVIAARLRQLLREGDIIGRYGGDEFIVVMRGGPDATLSPALLERVMQVVCEPVDIASHTLQITCSLGVAAFPGDGDDARTLLEHADAAMYRAKESGRNLYQLFNQDIHTRIVERAQIESALSQAIERNELFLEYQPKVAIDTGIVTGVEALLRWRHPELGVLGPERFIPFAEESQLINPIGEWVLTQACRDCMQWEAHGAGAINVAVNLSARQLSGFPLVRLVEQALATTGLAPSRLELELTETMMMSDLELTLETLRALNARGVRVSVDDFGTGYSNFAYLHRLPLSSLKIDRQFVTDLGQPGARDTEMVTHALTQLAHNLGLQVVAEGVETTQQLNVLRAQGCDQIQGWLHSKAMDSKTLEAMLRDYDAQVWLEACRAGAGPLRQSA